MQEAIKYFKMKIATHKKKVSQIILLAIKNLNKRRIYHDVSKTQSPEITLVSEAEYVADKDIKVNELKRKKLENDLNKGKMYHIFVNDHHAEYFENSIDPIGEFNLMGLIEMCCNWIAKNPDSPLDELEKLKQDFKVNKQVVRILKNTINFLIDKPNSKLKIKI